MGMRVCPEDRKGEIIIGIQDDVELKAEIVLQKDNAIIFARAILAMYGISK